MRVTHSSLDFLRGGGVAGLTFGLIFGLLQCLPVRLFGRRDLRLRSYVFSAILLSAGLVNPFIGWLRDATDSYYLPLMLTLGSSLIEVYLLIMLLRADNRSTASSTRSFPCVVEDANRPPGRYKPIESRGDGIM